MNPPHAGSRRQATGTKDASTGVKCGSPRVAIACSGLGHIRRGIEAWAEDLATALRQQGIAVDLFAGAPGVGRQVTCLRRGNPGALMLTRLFRHLGGWRYGFGSAYEIEQMTFAINLWRQVRTGYEILHVQDPLIARILDTAHRRHLSGSRVILANGTDEKPATLVKLAHVQELTPAAAQQWETRSPRPKTIHQIPNFVDTSIYHPGDRLAARRALDLPLDRVIILSCSAIRSHHKRVDYLIREFATSIANQVDPPLLVIAGARERDTDAIVAFGEAQLGSNVRFLIDCPREDMAALYRAADAFVLASLHEAFGIVLLEAMASGLPIVCHDAPGFRFVAGSCGLYADLSVEGGLAGAMREVLANRDRLAPLSRPHVETHFSQAAVAAQIVTMYQQVLAHE